jgi:tetratricopeptide (TPR) repeat protein
MVKNAEDRKKSGKGDFRDLLADEDESKKLEEEHQIIRTEEDARKAIKRITQKLKSTPDDKRLTRQLGDMYRRVKEYEHAEKIYQNLLEKDPNDLLAQERLGDLKEQKFADRVEELTEKCKDNPDDASLKTELKKAKEEQDDFLVVELERRVKAHPTDCGLKAKYGALLIRKNKIDEAVEQFQKALQDPRFSTQSHANLGRCFNIKGLYDLAVDEFGKALKQISDQNSTIWKDINYSLAETYAHKKDWDKARSTMEKILAVDIKFRDVSQKVQEYREQKG